MSWNEVVDLLDRFKYIIGIVGLLGIDVAPFVKANPVKWILRNVGNYMNESLKNDMDEKFKSQQDQINNVANELKSVREVTYDDHVKVCRNEIFRFGKECRKGNYGTKEHFIEVLTQLSEYERFCEEKHIINDAMPNEARYLRDLYNKLSLEGLLKDEN